MESSTSEVKGIGGSAIALFIFGLVAVIMIGIFFVFRGYMNKATEQVTGQMDNVLSQALTSYEDSTQTGADVLATIKTYRNDDLFIFVGTNNSMGGYYDPITKLAKGEKVSGYCYCGLPDGGAADTALEIEYNEIGGSAGTCYFIEKMSESSSGSSGEVLHNVNFAPLTTTSKTAQYVKQSAKFYSKCIYSKTTGEAIGIAFFQMN